MAAMTADENQPRTRKASSSGCLAALVLALAVLYPPSVGPACVAYERGWISKETLNAAYLPLIGLCHVSPTLKQCFIWYTEQWVRRLGPP